MADPSDFLFCRVCCPFVFLLDHTCIHGVDVVHASFLARFRYRPCECVAYLEAPRPPTFVNANSLALELAPVGLALCSLAVRKFDEYCRGSAILFCCYDHRIGLGGVWLKASARSLLPSGVLALHGPSRGESDSDLTGHNCFPIGDNVATLGSSSPCPGKRHFCAVWELGN